MALLKSQPLIEALRVDAAVMGQELHHLAALGARLLDRPSDQLFADAAAAVIGGDADILDQAARGALRAEARQHAELRATDATAALRRPPEPDVRPRTARPER